MLAVGAEVLRRVTPLYVPSLASSGGYYAQVSPTLTCASLSLYCINSSDVPECITLGKSTRGRALVGWKTHGSLPNIALLSLAIGPVPNAKMSGHGWFRLTNNSNLLQYHPASRHIQYVVSLQSGKLFKHSEALVELELSSS